MELHKNEQNKNKGSGKGLVVLVALFRLALLVGPEILLVKSLSRNPLICVLSAVAFLAIWLSVDVWPFRVSPAVSTAESSRPAPKAARTAYAQNLTKAQW